MNQEEQPTQPSVPPIEPEQPVTQHQGHTISVNLPQARMPVPGNAEWLLWLIVEIVFAIIWITSDAFDAGGFVAATTALTAAYLISRGIAKASRVLEH
jgi:nicotinamide riboside transporter PnuC